MLIGGRIRDINQFHRHQHCLYLDDNYICFEQDQINSSSHANKFYVILDFYPTETGEKIAFYKQQYLNILHNFNVPLSHICMISNTPIGKQLRRLYKNVAYLNMKDKNETVHFVNRFLIDNVLEQIDRKNLTNCSIILDVIALGTIRIDAHDLLVSHTGGNEDADFLNNQEFYLMMDSLYKSNKIRDVTYIMNSCYAGFKFGGMFFDWLIKTNKFQPNSNLLFSKPLLIYVYILILYLETNPVNINCLTDVNCQKYVETNLLNLGLGNHINLIKEFKEVCNKHEVAFVNLIDRQKTNPFDTDRGALNVFSNALLNLFNEVSNDASYLLFHNYLDSPFKQLDSLKNLHVNFDEFNHMLTRYYMDILKAYIRRTNNKGKLAPYMIAMGINNLGVIHAEKDLDFIMSLVNKSLSEVKHPFLVSLNGKGTRYANPDTPPILLEDLF